MTQEIDQEKIWDDYIELQRLALTEMLFEETGLRWNVAVERKMWDYHFYMRYGDTLTITSNFSINHIHEWRPDFVSMRLSNEAKLARFRYTRSLGTKK